MSAIKPDFSHRMASPEDELDLMELVDSVALAASRADAVLLALGMMADNEITMKGEYVSAALSSVQMDIADIKSMVVAFYEGHKNKPEPVERLTNRSR